MRFALRIRAGPVRALRKFVHTRADGCCVAQDHEHREQHGSTIGQAIQAITARNSAENGKSISAVSVAEVMKSRTVSKNGGGRERSHRCRPFLQAHAEHTLHDQTREIDVDAPCSPDPGSNRASAQGESATNTSTMPAASIHSVSRARLETRGRKRSW